MVAVVIIIIMIISDAFIRKKGGYDARNALLLLPLLSSRGVYIYF